MLPGRQVEFLKLIYHHFVCPFYRSSFKKNIKLLPVFEGVLDTLEYILYRANFTEHCRNSMNLALYELDELVTAGSTDRISEILNICHSIDTNDVQEVAFLFQTHYNFIMRHLDRTQWVWVCFQIAFFKHFHFYDARSDSGLHGLCNALTENSNESNLERFGNWLNDVQGTECRDTDYHSFVESLSNINVTSVAAISGARQSSYLQCTQSALFQITDDYTWVPNRIEFVYHNQMCRHIFGQEGYVLCC